MRAKRIVASLVLTSTALLAGAAGTPAALADDGTPSPSPADGAGAGPTEAGTSFDTAQLFTAGQEATADASSGDYLYWAVPVDAGRRATVKATVTYPDTSTRKGATTWQVDVYDGLRRHQSCMYGSATRTLAAADSGTTVSCTLRTVRAWAEPWSNDPLPGDYYIRLTAVRADQADLGIPMHAAVGVSTSDKGGASAVGGKLAAPLVPNAGSQYGGSGGDAGDSATPAPTDTASGDGTGTEAETVAAPANEPDGGWSSGWWTDRWLWTGGGAVLAALAGIGGYRLTRPRRDRGRRGPEAPLGY
jgi:hypothetical protein